MEDFRAWAVKAAEWGVDYRTRLRDLPVRPNIKPGDIAAQIAPTPPEEAEPFERIFSEFESIVVPGTTHWQHPRFFAYFPSNAAPASIVAEHLVNYIAAVCMLWQTGPAATRAASRTPRPPQRSPPFWSCANAR
jgi:aromatic-L-amino-acid decarboxylase